MRKPALRKVALGFKIALLTILLIAGILTWRSGYRNALHYRDVKDTAVPVSATITYIEEWEDSEGSTYYDAHVTYSYEGQNYSQVYGGSRRSRVGDIVKVDINPENPAEIMQKTHSTYKVTIAVGSLFLGLAYAAAKMGTREGWCATFGISREMIHQDLLEKVKCETNGLGFLLVAIGAAAGWMVSRTDTILLLMTVGFAVMGVRLLITFIAETRLIKKQEYTIQRDRLIEKRLVPDSEGADAHYLKYKTSDGVAYEISVSHKRYQRAMEGDEILSVFLPNKKKPYMTVDLQDRSTC